MGTAATLKCMFWLLCLLIVSCPDEPRSPIGPVQGWQPEGSKIDFAGDTLQVTAPAGWAYAGYESDGKFFNIRDMAGSSISYSCNSRLVHCLPLVAELPPGGGSITGCQGQNTDCIMQESLVLEGGGYSINSGGYYATNTSTRLLRDGESAPAVFEALLELDAFKTALKNFYDEAYQGKPVQLPVLNRDGSLSAPESYCLVALTIMGRGMLTVVPQDYAGGQLGYVPLVKAYCSCDKQTCGIKAKSVGDVGLVYYQEACPTSTLTTSNLASNTTPYVIDLPSYKY